MTIKFIAMHGSIQSITVTRETASTIWFRSDAKTLKQRYPKKSPWYWFGDTFDHAKQKMLEAYEHTHTLMIEQHETDVQFSNEKIAEIKALTPL